MIDHRADHGRAVRGRQRARRAEREHEADDGEEHDRVGRRHVDLAALVGRRLADLHARQQVELHGLARHGERARDRRLRRDDVGRRREHDERRQQRRAARARRTDSRRARRPSAAARPGRSSSAAAPATRAEPREPHGLLTEVPHVRIQRLGARQHEEHGAQDRQRDAGMRREQRHRVARRHARRALRARRRSRERRARPACRTTAP